MARTTQQIYDSLIQQKNSMTELNGLQPNIDDAQTLLSDVSTNSKVADWRLWVWLVAWSQSVLEGLWDKFKTEVEELASQANYGSLPWYPYIAKQYQHGDTIQFIDNQWQYATVDLAAQIIKKAAAVENTTNQEVVVKVAKSGGTPLTTAEKTAFEAYLSDISPAGINTTVISQDPDDLKLELEIFYDPLVLASDGSLLSTPSVFPVEDAITSFVDTGIEFNGAFLKTLLQDALQSVEGVTDPRVRYVWSRVGVAPYVEIGDQKVAESGHFRIDPLLTFASQITYTPYV